MTEETIPAFLPEQPTAAAPKPADLPTPDGFGKAGLPAPYASGKAGDIALQLAGFEDRVTQKLAGVADKVDTIAQALVDPVLAEVVPLPAAPADAPEAPGLISTVAHKVAEIAEGTVDAVRSLAAPRDGEELGYSDAEIAAATAPVSRAAPVAEVAPLGPHTQAVEERRMQQSAPSIVAA